MTLLLDENFPLQLYHHLKADGHDVDHIVIAGQRGLPDSAILRRLQSEDALVFVTQDTEFLAAVVNAGCAVIVSRVPQRLPINERVDRWTRALVGFLATPRQGQLFEILPDGQLSPLKPGPP